MNKRTPLLLGFLVVVIGLGSYLVIKNRQDQFARQAHLAYQTQISALRAEGVPTQLIQLQEPLPPIAQDAGPIFQQIDDEVKAHPPAGSDKILTDGFPARHMPSPKEISDAHDALSHEAHLMALIHTAAERPKCDLHINWTNPDPASVLFPQFAHIRMSARALAVESFDLARQGRMREAVQTQALGFRLADHAYTGKIMIGSLVGIAVDAITLEGMHKILYLSHGDPAVAQQVIDAIQNNYHSPRCADALGSELTFHVAEIEYLRTAGIKSLLDDLSSDSQNAQQKSALESIGQSQWNAFLDDNGAFMTEPLRRSRLIADQPYPISHPQLIAIDEKFQQDLHRYGANNRYLLAEILQPTVAKFASKKASIDADALIVQTSARLLIENSKTHAFPASLSTLPNIPNDPFTGKPFPYRREGAGFVLYSVGDEGNFDGGTLTAAPKSYEPMFRYPVPAYYTEPIKTP